MWIHGWKDAAYMQGQDITQTSLRKPGLRFPTYPVIHQWWLTKVTSNHTCQSELVSLLSSDVQSAFCCCAIKYQLCDRSRCQQFQHPNWKTRNLISSSLCRGAKLEDFQWNRASCKQVCLHKPKQTDDLCWGLKVFLWGLQKKCSSSGRRNWPGLCSVAAKCKGQSSRRNTSQSWQGCK